MIGWSTSRPPTKRCSRACKSHAMSQAAGRERRRRMRAENAQRGTAKPTCGVAAQYEHNGDGEKQQNGNTCGGCCGTARPAARDGFSPCSVLSAAHLPRFALFSGRVGVGGLGSLPSARARGPVLCSAYCGFTTERLTAYRDFERSLRPYDDRLRSCGNRMYREQSLQSRQLSPGAVWAAVTLSRGQPCS